MKLTNLWEGNWMNAIRGMRYPKNSDDKMDSNEEWSNEPNFNWEFVLGENDKSLLIRLCKAGTDHRKILRQVFVSASINAPLYFWKQLDTYKVATVSNSRSTMHRLTSRPLTIEDFETEETQDDPQWQDTIEYLNRQIDNYNHHKKIIGKPVKNDLIDDDLRKKRKQESWNNLMNFLPASYLQERMYSCNYEVLLNIIHARLNHKLPQWKQFCRYFLDRLSYLDIIYEATKK